MSLEHEMRRVLLALELVSQGTTQAWDSEGGHAPPSSRPPAGVNWAGRKDDGDDRPALRYARAWARCATDTAREQLLADAIEYLAACRRARRPASDPQLDTIYWREDVANDPRPAGEVARINGITRQYVYKLRRLYRKAA